MFFTVTVLILLLYTLQNSSTYWEGKADAETLQRIYGISFPEPKQLKEWKHFQEEAAKRDHRKIGKVGIHCLHLSIMLVSQLYQVNCLNIIFQTI